jgi:prevent-host-death family protein
MSTISLADARSRFSQIIESASSTHERFEITKNGERVALIIGADDFDSLIETLEILADRDQTRDILQGMRELQDGKSVGSAEMRDIMRKAGRLSE